jgi:hypothetical protein
MCFPQYENLETDEVWVFRWGLTVERVTEKMQWLSYGGRLYETGLAAWLRYLEEKYKRNLLRDPI